MGLTAFMYTIYYTMIYSGKYDQQQDIQYLGESGTGLYTSNHGYWCDCNRDNDDELSMWDSNKPWICWENDGKLWFRYFLGIRWRDTNPGKPQLMQPDNLLKEHLQDTPGFARKNCFLQVVVVSLIKSKSTQWKQKQVEKNWGVQ